MSTSRKKAKKQLKKQNRSQKQIQTSLPRAKRKGGRYVYPAGAYRSVKDQIPEPKPLPLIIPVPEIQPEPELVPEIPAPPVAETAQVPERMQSEQSQTDFGLGRKYMIAFGCAAMAFMAGMLFRPAKAPARMIMNAVKETSAALKQSDSLKLSEAEPLPELSVDVNLKELKEPLEKYLSDLDGDWAVYIRNLNNDETLSINDHQMPSASLIKLYTAGCYLEELEEGNLEENWRSENDLARMISWSDNNAWQDLETVIGHGNYIEGLQMVTAFARAQGYENTGRLIGGDTVYSADANNFTSVSETADVLYRIFQGTYVSSEASQRILELMLEQHITTKIPAGLPEGIVSANKTGELSGIENDAAIVYGLNTDYILVIMSDDNYRGTAPVAELSEYIYGLLNPGSVETEELTNETDEDN